MNFARVSWLLSVAILLRMLALSAPAFGQTPSFYMLSPGDGVEVKFFYNPELNETVVIRPDGKISLALVGEVTLSGKTPGQASEELASRYKSLVKNPSITVQVRSFAGQRVYVGGEVTRAGVLPLVAEQTVLDAVLEAGGLKHTSADYVMLIRQGTDGKPVMRRVSIHEHKHEASEASQLTVQAFDVVLAPESKIAVVDRWVDQYIRQVIPVYLNAGFSYLANGLVAAH